MGKDFGSSRGRQAIPHGARSTSECVRAVDCAAWNRFAWTRYDFPYFSPGLQADDIVSVMARNCPNCSLELLPPLYTTCRTCARTHQNAKCSLCRLPADRAYSLSLSPSGRVADARTTDLIQSCSVCFHAGHSSCLTKWFEQFDFCPSGCGHS